MDDYGERLYQRELKWRSDPNRWSGGTDEDYERRHGCWQDQTPDSWYLMNDQSDMKKKKKRKKEPKK